MRLIRGAIDAAPRLGNLLDQPEPAKSAGDINLGNVSPNGVSLCDVDMLRQMVRFMAQRLMEIDVEVRCGAGYDEKSAARLNSRNGYRDRSWETRAGTVELKIPKPRPRV